MKLIRHNVDNVKHCNYNHQMIIQVINNTMNAFPTYQIEVRPPPTISYLSDALDYMFYFLYYGFL